MSNLLAFTKIQSVINGRNRLLLSTINLSISKHLHEHNANTVEMEPENYETKSFTCNQNKTKNRP